MCSWRHMRVRMCARHGCDLIRWILTRPRLNLPDVSAVPNPSSSQLQTIAITSAGLHGNAILPPVDGALIRAAIMGWLYQGGVVALIGGTGGCRVGSGLAGQVAVVWAPGLEETRGNTFIINFSLTGRWRSCWQFSPPGENDTFWTRSPFWSFCFSLVSLSFPFLSTSSPLSLFTLLPHVLWMPPNL